MTESLNSGPLVSVLIPCYNAERFLQKALDSIIGQAYTNLEIIVIDDGSTDNTSNILHRYATKDSRVKFYKNHENRKLIYTLNRGIEIASGKYLARMDSDDIAAKDRIEKLVHALEHNPNIDIISSASFLMNVKGRVINKAIPKAICPKALKFVSFFSTPLLHPAMMVKTEIIKKHLFNYEFIHSEDFELFSRLIHLGYQAFNIDDFLLYYRINPYSVSNKYERIQINSHTRISMMNIENYFGYSPEYFLHKVIINRIGFDVSLSLIKRAFKTLVDLKKEFVEREDCDEKEKKEIDLFLNEQRIDIIFQSIKHTAFYKVLPLLFFLIVNIEYFISKRGFKYVLSKIGSKTTF